MPAAQYIAWIIKLLVRRSNASIRSLHLPHKNCWRMFLFIINNREAVTNSFGGAFFTEMSWNWKELSGIEWNSKMELGKKKSQFHRNWKNFHYLEHCTKQSKIDSILPMIKKKKKKICILSKILQISSKSRKIQVIWEYFLIYVI